MFNLIKKDFITSIKWKSILYILVITYIITTMGYIFPLPFQGTIPFYNVSAFLGILIAYFCIMNTFYYDSLNKSNEFILSIPTKREDIVYAKYIFSLIMILLSLTIVNLVYTSIIGAFGKYFEFKDVSFSLSVLLLSFSIIIPLIFKMGYEKMRLIAPAIVLVIYTLTIYIFKPIETKIFLINQYGSFSSTISGASLEQQYSKFYTFVVNSIDIKFINYTTIPILMLVIFIISIIITNKIFKVGKVY